MPSLTRVSTALSEGRSVTQSPRDTILLHRGQAVVRGSVPWEEQQKRATRLPRCPYDKVASVLTLYPNFGRQGLVLARANASKICLPGHSLLLAARRALPCPDCFEA